MSVETIKVSTNCPFCLGQNTLDVSLQGYNKWQHGALIQDALPELSASKRELLITGICDECFPSDGDHRPARNA